MGRIPNRTIACLIFALSAAVISCDGSSSGKTAGPDKPSDGTEDIRVLDGKVTFYISSATGGAAEALGMEGRGDKVIYSGKSYDIQKDASGRSYVSVPASTSGNYQLALVNGNSGKFYSTAPNVGLKLPYSQFSETTTESLRDYPLFASYSKETGNRLFFEAPFALLDIALTGNASICSVRIENGDRKKLAGCGPYSYAASSYSIAEGQTFIVLNTTCSGRNVSLGDSPVHFLVPIAPGRYDGGLTIRACDSSHKAFTIRTGAVQIASGSVLSVRERYEPDGDLVFFEGFDNMVWGGDYAAGASAGGYVPESEPAGTEGGIDLTGYEEALYDAAYDAPGTGFIQSNNWDDCLGKDVATSHRLTDSYIHSRSLDGYIYLFRVQEFQGYAGVGVANTTRGILKTGAFSAMKGICEATVSFDFCLKEGFDDRLSVQISNGGSISQVTVDGREAPSSSISFSGVTSTATLDKSLLGAAKVWHKATVRLDKATGGTCLYLSSDSATSGNHGFFVDNIEVRSGSRMERGNLRVLYWNIQNGMWSDQGNGYDNFVEWVKRYDPDICVWCEAATIYKDGTSVAAPTQDRFLPDGWPSLAGRYGHTHTALGGWRDNFPQVITSRFPITTLLRITDGETSAKPISHGAAIHDVVTDKGTVRFVTLHTWPQKYGYGVPESKRAASEKANEGDLYREYEMKYILDNTYLSPQYSGCQDWIIAADMNSRSRLDNHFYKYAASSTAFLCQNQILDRTDLVDVIASTYDGEFHSSTFGSSRIDYFYTSPSMSAKVKNALILIDDWAAGRQDLEYGTTFRHPSDHSPILVDFDL